MTNKLRVPISKFGARALSAALLVGSAFGAWAPAFAFSLPKERVFPRIFTPNGDGINDVVYFNVANPSLDSLEGRIYDMSGNRVADIRFDSPISVPGSDVTERWVWDGKDGNGNTVRSGVYIYEVQGGGNVVTGTVVVAK